MLSWPPENRDRKPGYRISERSRAEALHVSLGKSGEIALWIAAFETMTNRLLFYLHERAWAPIPWGRAYKEIASRPDEFTHH